MQSLYARYRKWALRESLKEEGIIIASDITQQWLIPWWWSHYSRFNQFPVTFIDLGMSEEMKQWCSERGEFIQLPVADIFVAEKPAVSPHLSQEWEGIYGARFWPSRQAWFKKPMACLLSPYRRSIWIDLDCEIRGNLKSLFALCDTPSGITLAEENHESAPHRKGYNSGLIIFKRGLSLIEEWADRSIEQNDSFAGDQDVLSQIIHEKQLSIDPLSQLYNWSRCYPENAEAIILHWHGSYGKSYIHHQIISSQLQLPNC